MKLLITGSGGFVGKALLKYIQQHLQDVSVTLLSSSERTTYTTIVYEKRGGEYLFNLDDEYDTVLHLGAWTPKSGREPNDVDRSCSNISFTNALLDRLPGRVKRFIFVSTLDVYSPEENIINERSRIAPVSLYGSSKLFCERMVEAWCSQHDVSHCILRLGHIYGEGEEEYQKAIPVWIAAALANKPITIFTDGNEYRSFLYIRDCVRYISEAIFRTEVSGIYNVVSANSYRIKEIAGMIRAISGSDSAIEIKGASKAARSLTFDAEKLVSAFNVKETDVHEGLRAEIEYFSSLKHDE